MNPTETSTPPASPEPPTAELRDAPRRSWAGIVPILALALAVWFLARAWDQRGLPITIHFKDGHGIKAGDALRYRGIQAGEVEAVRLAPDLGGVDVVVALAASSEALARSGSSFWVVRPRVEPEGITGLDTLVGAHYLNVLPGPESSGFSDHFVGLEEAPVITPPGSLELVLEAAEGGSVRRGAQITWRRLPVGHVLSVGLSSDARTVEVRVAIAPEFASLVHDNTRFFETSGFDLNIGLQGLNLEMESLQSLIAGGIAIATPDENAAPATTGQRFTLYAEAREEWLEWRPALAIGDTNLPIGMVAPRPQRARLTYEKGLLRLDRAREGWALWLQAGLLGPADLVRSPEEAKDAAALEVSGETYPLLALPEPGEELAVLLGLDRPSGAPAGWPRERMRPALEPEDCMAIGDPALAPMALDAELLGAGPPPWKLDGSLPVPRDWHGAAVLSRTDGALLGLLLVDDRGARVAGLPKEFLP